MYKRQAQELLGFIPGTDMFAKRIERLKDDLEVKTEGLLRPRKILVYKPPANIRPVSYTHLDVYKRQTLYRVLYARVLRFCHAPGGAMATESRRVFAAPPQVK